MDQNIIVLGIAFLAIIIIIVAYQRVKSAGRLEDKDNETTKQDATYLREILSRDQLIQNLQNRIENLNELNNRYLSFMLNVPTVVQRLHATLKFDEIISSITGLVSTIIATDKVELYIFDPENELLKKVPSRGQAPEEQISYALGEGLVGMAAQDRMVRRREHLDKRYIVRKDDHHDNSPLWMAVPINFKERLLGAIGIGQVKDPIGNESNLIKMIADIAGVVLLNHFLLGEAKQRANTDSLTGLYNRNYFFHMAQNFVEKSISDGSPISIFLFDIDNFKHYNDTNGHDEGDSLLKELSLLVREVTRKNSIIVRYGGEEFIIMLPGISKEDAFVYAERLRENVANHPFPHREKQPLGCISISGGIASFPTDGDSIPKVINLVDKALYQAKSEGRNRIVMYKPFLFSEPETGNQSTEDLP